MSEEVGVLGDENQGNDTTVIDLNDEAGLEDVGKAEHEPSPEHPRFKQIYGKMKQYERDLAELSKKLEEKDSLMEELKNHNRRLAESIERAVAGRDAKRETNDILDNLKGEIDKLKERRKEALEREDFATADELSDALIDKKLELKEAERAIKAMEHSKSKRMPPEAAEIVQRFISETPWWYEDPVMRGAAISVEAALASDQVWGNKPLKERLDEVRRRVEERFGVSDKKGGMSGVEGVGSYGRPSSGKGRSDNRFVKLTSEQISIAKSLGISPEEYARQLYIMEKEEI